jgi:hypothetical protein
MDSILSSFNNRVSSEAVGVANVIVVENGIGAAIAGVRIETGGGINALTSSLPVKLHSA